MVTWVWLSDRRIFAACLPIESTTINDHTTKAGAMSSDELGCGMNNDICTMLDRTNQIRCSEGIVDRKRKTMLVCDLCDSIDIRNI